MSGTVLAHPAAAQNVNQVIVFGDSNVDSGFYRALPNPGGGSAFNAAWASAVLAGAGRPTSSPGLMSPEVLAAYFGLTALPSNQPGGTNYATSGARSDLPNGPGDQLFRAAVPTTGQVSQYLSDNGGKANPDALYLVKSGDNDIAWAVPGGGGGFASKTPAAVSYLNAQADALVAGIGELSAAGARYIIVPNYAESFGGGLTSEYRALFADRVWSGLEAAGVSFIPADFNAVRVAIRDDYNSGRKAFGFEFIDNSAAHTACVRPPGIGDAYALLCSTDPAAPSHYATPDADQTRLFADATGHLSTAGQKIVGDYYYSLVVAPSQISFLPEAAVKTRSRLVADIQAQIEATKQQPAGPTGINAWVIGDVSSLQMDSYAGFPDVQSTPGAATAGFALRSGGLILGGAVSVGHLRSDFGGGRGGFEQDEVAGSVYAGFSNGAFWSTLIGTYGRLDYDVSRLVPVGITVQSNSGSTDGENLSLAAQAGIGFKAGALTHGPVAGITWQRISVDGFAESGSFTRLAFADQSRLSAIGSLGWQAALDLGTFRPFAQLAWKHELASSGRNVTASLLTTDAPSYEMPAVAFGRDWGTAAVGVNVILAPGVTGLAAVSTDFGQGGVETSGAQIGLNVAF